ncbi:MAG: NAD-dependent epimerase/dehydratase family protein [Chloroflexota bacterium]|jgi:nucleoside-diphosphate-sugar epimerase
MKAFVTGGTGFVGRHVVRKLLERGYDVYGLARSEKSAAVLSKLGAQPVYGNILDRESMREGMEGNDVVFHIAGWYKIGSRDWMRAESINVAGTRNVLGLAHELGVPKIIYTSTVAVFGDTKGQLADENYYQGGPFATEYDRTKWLAHYKVAQPLIDKGAPITIVMPGVIYGPHDHDLVGELMVQFYKGRLFVVPGSDFIATYAHVEDIAEGHILAAEKGRIGESYILAGPAVPLGEVVDFWGQLTGKPVPLIRIPSRFLVPLAPLLDVLGSVIPLPDMLSAEAARLLGVSYMARSDKARAELGWRTRSMQEGMGETFRWIAGTTPVEPLISQRERKIAGLTLLVAAFLLLLWFIGRRRD